MDVEHTAMLEQHLGHYLKADSPAMQKILAMMKDEACVKNIAHGLLLQASVLSEATGGMLENQGFELIAQEVFNKLNAEYQKRYGGESMCDDMNTSIREDIDPDGAAQHLQLLAAHSMSTLNSDSDVASME